MTTEPKRRGHRVADLDAVDLRIAAADLDAGRQELAAAHAMTDRAERVEAIRAALDRLSLAGRLVVEVVERRRGPKTRTKHESLKGTA